ncbi:amino acid/amide ABC transporter membrane protein 1 (HAAT family) [Antricoccus suffuscus]|uniref:Amino acid/amide ABC transporter membrane protein 1 (HAAT family) n=1 Tax=Antricoccus suffuscus TaxID=1629062 RepID=A0A2T1A130_9ACTN|nr:branched-chain amino acid ABC transporter permease [Antricoccus suffuscus]PRZ42311.1 amino acid/amide ABC transporter membrane protein 1 (HAAT family) [Antricoccus suffuscus]
MQQLIQTLMSGILVGGLYGVFSSGLTLIFGITRVINFAHGDFVTLGMFGAVLLFTSLGINPLISIIPVAIGTFIIGALIYSVIIRRTLVVKGITAIDAQHGQLVLTLAVSILISNSLLMLFGPSSRSVSGFLGHSYNIAGIYLSEARLVSFIVAVVLFLLLYLALQRTLYGKAIRATVDDRDMASMVGINPNRVFLLSFSVGTMLTGIAGCVLAMYYPVTPTTGQQFLVIAFVTVVMGGLGDIVGAFVAGIVVGIIQQLTAVYVAIDLQNAGLFVAFVLILVFRPQGILSRKRVGI